MTSDARTRLRPMDAPPIQYARTADGVNIACQRLGDGPPLIWASGLGSVFQLGWATAKGRPWFDRLTEQRTLIAYDPRGFGLSDPLAGDLDLDAELADLRAVMDHFEFPTYDLSAIRGAAVVGLAAAAREPDRVSHLVLWSPLIEAEFGKTTAGRFVLRLPADDPLVKSLEALAAGGADEVGIISNMFGVFPDKATWGPYATARQSYDLTATLSTISTPILILHPERHPWIPLDYVRDIATRLPTSRLVVRAGDAQAPFLDPNGEALSAVQGFLTKTTATSLVPSRSGTMQGHARSALPCDASPGRAPAKREIGREPIDGPEVRLTQREREVLRCVAAGMRNREIAERLVISPSTVANHVSNILRKTGAKNRTEAAQLVQANGRG